MTRSWEAQRPLPLPRVCAPQQHPLWTTQPHGVPHLARAPGWSSPYRMRASATFAAISLTLFGLSLPAFILQSSVPKVNLALPSILLCLSSLWLVACAAAARSKVAAALALGRPDAGATLLLFGGFAIVILILIRLVASHHFGGTIVTFDFGLKCTADANASSCEQNQAFTPEFNSFGHCIQGTLSVLLLPGIEETLAARCVPRNLIRASSSFVAVYPIYNVIKRAAKSASGFASSSFANNGAEWAMGFMLGVSAGVAAQAVAAAREGAVSPSPRIAVVITAGKRSRLDMACGTARLVAGASLCLIALLAAILLGASWDNTAFAAHEDDLDLAMLVTFLAVPLCLAIGWLVCAQGHLGVCVQGHPGEPTEAAAAESERM